nr:flavodoxin [Candidatus Sigynarchaeota archaeon]
MAKILVVYYSFEGNTKLIADSIATAVGADILRLEVERELKSHGFAKYLWGGRQVVMKSKPRIKPLDKSPTEYDTLFIGTPVWAYTFSPALRTFFSTVKLSGKKIALFCSCGGDRRKTFEHMKAQLAGNEILGEFETIEPLKNDTSGQTQRVVAWAKQMLKV